VVMGSFPLLWNKINVMFFTPNDSDKISIHHKNSSIYPSIILSTPSPNPKEYYNYILAGYKSILIPNNVKNPVGIDILVDGNVPIGLLSPPHPPREIFLADEFNPISLKSKKNSCDNRS